MQNSYDVVRYPTGVHNLTLPSALGTLAHLRGRGFTPFSQARVLEIGCGTGHNLMSLGMMAPQAEFVGFDLAADPIADGQALAAAAGLSNVALKVGDILDPAVVSGEFDYIIAHGVLAWIPPVVARALMELFGRHLSRDGLVFVSYNVLPGVNTRKSLRTAVLEEVADIADPAEKLAKTRETLEFLIAEWGSRGALHAALIEEARRMMKRPPQVLFHDELGDWYEPRLVGDVVAEAQGHGLEFLAESQPFRAYERFYPSAKTDGLRGRTSGDRVRLEQLEDFVTQRQFRETILCRSGAAIVEKVDWTRVPALFAQGQFNAARASEPDRFVFGNDEGARFEVHNNALGVVLRSISQAYPACLPLEGVVTSEEVGEALFMMHSMGSLKLLTEPLQLAATPGDRPEASRLARAQAARGETQLASLQHIGVDAPDKTGALFLGLLDGTRSRGEIAEALAGAIGITVEQGVAMTETALTQLAQPGMMAR